MIMITFKKNHKSMKFFFDFSFLQRITLVAKYIAESLSKHEINVLNSNGQSCDTTASMSSSKVGVH